MEFHIGCYSIDLPRSATIASEVGIPPTDRIGWGFVYVVAKVGRYRFSFHLDPCQVPSDLARFILSTTKQSVALQAVQFNGVPGVCYGSYNPQRTWFDWWLKKGDSMLCINLQTDITPNGAPLPTDEELFDHRHIIESVRYIPDAA